MKEMLYRKGDRIKHNIPTKSIPLSYIKTLHKFKIISFLFGVFSNHFLVFTEVQTGMGRSLNLCGSVFRPQWEIGEVPLIFSNTITLRTSVMNYVHHLTAQPNSFRCSPKGYLWNHIQTEQMWVKMLYSGQYTYMYFYINTLGQILLWPKMIWLLWSQRDWTV